MPDKKTYRRYLVVRVEFEIDCTKTDQNCDDHVDEIAQTLSSELDYNVSFDGKIEAGDGAGNAIEVPVKITDTEVVSFDSELGEQMDGAEFEDMQEQLRKFSPDSEDDEDDEEEINRRDEKNGLYGEHVDPAN